MSISMLITLGFWFLYQLLCFPLLTSGCFRVKFLADGALDKYKARLVAREFLQEFRVDYSENFSPVVKTSTIKVVLTLVLSKGMESEAGRCK